MTDLPLNLLVTASEPVGEGRQFAAELRVPCIEDSDASRMISEVAAVLVGADAIGHNSFINKVGTARLATAARDAGKPFFVVAEGYKWIDQADCNAGGLFEAISNELVTSFLTDHLPGPQNPSLEKSSNV